MVGGVTVEPSAEAVPNAPDGVAAGDELPPPQPARIAAIRIVIDQVSGLVTFSILFICISPK